MVKLLAATIVWLLCGAVISAQAAERPGAFERTVGSYWTNQINDVDVSPDGRIIVTGIGDGYPRAFPWVRAYLPNGDPDPSFGENGMALLQPDRRVQVGTVVQPDGRIVVGQSSLAYFEPVPHLIRRLNPDGTPDETFGDSGTIQPYFGGYGSELWGVSLLSGGGMMRSAWALRTGSNRG